MNHHLLVFSVGRILQACPNVFLCEAGEIRENLLVRHARGKVLKNIIDGDAHASDAGLPASLAGFHGDDVSVIFDASNSTTPPIQCLSIAPWPNRDTAAAEAWFSVSSVAVDAADGKGANRQPEKGPPDAYCSAV